MSARKLKQRKKPLHARAIPGSFDAVLEEFSRLTSLTKKDSRWVAEVLFATMRDAVWKHGRLAVKDLGVFRISEDRPIEPDLGGGSNVVPLSVPPVKRVKFRASKNWRTG